MNNENVMEWLRLADNDLYSAKILNEAARKSYEIICYHCAQAVEKYLKGYLVFVHNVDTLWTNFLKNRIFAAFRRENARSVRKVTDFVDRHYLTYQDVIPKNTHDLVFLNSLCTEKDIEFQNIKSMCNFLNRFANDIRYPHKYEVSEDDINISINAAENVSNIKPVVSIRNKIHNADDKKEDIVK
jgi:HEPN domain-containing protein